MMYNLGAVGFGHWFNRLYIGMEKSKELKLAKVAGVSSVEGKLDRLRSVGLSEREYYRIDDGGSLPEDFYSNLDIVHISDPNKYHAEQTIDSLRKGKLTVTEKTWGVNRQEFDDVVKFIKENKMENRAYLHLHYLHKQLTLVLKDLLERYTSEYGKINKVSATFFEVEGEEDSRRRAWLFSKHSGGIFMDWIHPFEILYFGALAKSVKLEKLHLLEVKPEYDTENPTGVAAGLMINGRFFRKNTKGTIRVAKGTTQGLKTIRFYFDTGAYLDLEYVHSELEFNSNERGKWTLCKNGRIIESGRPEGPDTSQIFANEILDMCRGKKAGLTLDEAAKLFEPQWLYQDMAKGMQLERSQDEINAFLSKGMALE
jgi:predicted dehydrogenase